VDNRERALRVFTVASLLEARGANPYRVRAYRRSAFGLLALPKDASAYLDKRGDLALPTLGPHLRRKLGELVRTNALTFQDELMAELPAPMCLLMTVPGIGPILSKRLIEDGGILDLEGLARAARQGSLRKLQGVGPGRERAWGESAELLLTKAA
jgi:DNA polymerase (family 10)